MKQARRSTPSRKEKKHVCRKTTSKSLKEKGVTLGLGTIQACETETKEVSGDHEGD